MIEVDFEYELDVSGIIFNIHTKGRLLESGTYIPKETKAYHKEDDVFPLLNGMVTSMITNLSKEMIHEEYLDEQTSEVHDNDPL